MNTDNPYALRLLGFAKFIAAIIIIILVVDLTMDFQKRHPLGFKCAFLPMATVCVLFK